MRWQPLGVGLGAWFLLPILVAGADAAPDLVITGVDVSALGWVDVDGRATGGVQAAVRNAGDQPAGPEFVVVFFEDRNGNGSLDPSDLWIGRASHGPLAAGAVSSVSLAFSAALEFRHSPIHALADSGNLVAESDELNNLAHSGLACEFTRPTGPMDAAVQWSWPAPGDSFPLDANVMSSPAVVDLDADGVPEVVVPTTASTAGLSVLPGFLRALRGSDGSILFNVSHPALRVNAAASVAVGDLDGDGRPEIVACDSTGTALLCFEHDGSFKWRSPALEVINWGAPSMADLDADGVPEVVIGRQALNANGTLRWTGTGGRGASAASTGPLSTVADVNLDGSPDVVAGNTIYNANGTIQVMNTSIADGLVAVANLDSDAFPEIVHVVPGQVRVLEHTLVPKWGPVMMPGTGGGGPPTIADFDGDGQAEIAVQGFNRLVVFERDSTIRWSSTIADLSSGRTGCTAFDFDGDGAAEAVARDEKNIWIFRGTDGATLQQIPLSSCTWHEYALVADVDADGDAEIVTGANNNCPVIMGTDQGVRVYRSAGDRWVATRRVWNQHTYHVTNIADDASIPLIEPRNWLHPSLAPLNDFRESRLTGGASRRASADLTASRLAAAGVCSAYVALTARVGNAGSVIAPRGVPVSFYDDDPGAGGTLLATTQTATVLEPGSFEDVGITLPGPLARASHHPDSWYFTDPVYVVVDDQGGLSGTQTECDEANNLLARSFPACPVLAGVGFDAAGREPLLEQNRPNPFVAGTVLAFVLPEPGATSLVVFDASGRRVRQVLVGHLPAGRHSAVWNGADDHGRRQGAGIYFVRLEAGGRVLSRRMAIIR